MILRKREKNDDSFIFEILPKDEEGIYLWSNGYYSYPLNIDDYIDGQQELSKKSFFLTSVENNPVGSVNYSRKEESVHLRFIVCQKGKGQIMLKGVLNYFFKELKVRYVTLKVFKANPRAFCCYGKVGFQIEKEYDTYYDMICRREWIYE